MRIRTTPHLTSRHALCTSHSRLVVTRPWLHGFVSARAKMRSRSSATPAMFQTPTVQPHPHCFCPLHIPWAIRLMAPHLAVLCTSVLMNMLAQLAQKLSGCWLPLPSSVGTLHRAHLHDCETPVVTLSTTLIVSCVFCYFRLCGGWNQTRPRPPSPLTRLLIWSRAFSCPHPG